MQLSTQTGTKINDHLTAWFFFEHICPICNYVYMQVMFQLELNNVIRVFPIEIFDNAATPEVNWFHQYSANVGGEITPTIRLVDTIPQDIGYSIHPVQVFHLWEEKGETVETADLKKAQRLHEQIVEAVEKYRRITLRDTHNMKTIGMNPVNQAIPSFRGYL